MSENPPGTDLVLSSRQERAIAARDAIEGGGRPAALVPRTFLEAQAFCGALATSDLIPQKLKDHAADVLVIVLAGIELGLAPMQSLRMHHVIEGVPRLSADGLAAIVLASPLCEYLECSESSPTRCTWITKRRGRPERSVTWTIERAQRAGLPDKKNRDGSPGMWVKYPENMLSSRSKAEICRLTYPDIVGGLITREEAYDGAIDAEFTEVRATGFVAPPPALAPAPAPAPPPASAIAEPVKRGPGRPPKDRPIETTATEVAAPAAPAAKLDAAIETVRHKPQPQPEIVRPAEARPVEPAPGPAPTSVELPVDPAPAPPAEDGFGEDPPDVDDTGRSPAAFTAWLATCRTQAQLSAGKADWLAWSKRVYAQGSDEARALQRAFAERKAQVPA